MLSFEMFRAAILCVLLQMLIPACVVGQQSPMQDSYESATIDPATEVFFAPSHRSLPPWVYPVSSLLIPGSGQLLRGHERGVLYLAAEAFLLLRFWSHRADGQQNRQRYLDLAFTVARAPFRPARRDTVFEYYEAMESYLESGLFNTGTGPELIPPTDESTFNGYVWRLARETFLANPDTVLDTDSDAYQRAIDFYKSRAIGPNFQWSWRDAGLERDLFRRSIRHSDRALKVATQYLGLVLANHLIGSIDAFVTERLASQVSVGSGLAVAPYGRGDVVVHICFRVDL